jgi:NADH:ubiquinone oxidoreductase subunit 4 (subunit M)
LWYGYIYYIFFNILLLSVTLYFLRLFFLNSLLRLNTFLLLNRFFLSIMSFFLFVTLVVLNYLMDYYQDLIYISSLNSTSDIEIVNVLLFDHFFFINSLNLNVCQVYYYPFIYVFLLVTVLSILFCLSYNSDEVVAFMFYCQVILIAGYVLFFTDSLILFFLSYEMLLIPSFFILYKFAKTRRCVEAAYLMFFWTQFGALFLIFALIYLFLICDSSIFTVISLNYFSGFEVNFLFVCCLIGFGVKLPIWPFYGWLPKAHVEASTNFSIFLSGVLVKFAFFGLMKCLITIQLEPTFIYVYPFLVIGIIDAVFKLFYQIDLKKLVAYSTVVEMHWLTICVVSGQSNLMLANFCMLISHALLSTNSFLLVDAVARRFKTRLITEVSGINFLCPKLFLAILLNSLIFLGFPGSIFFVAEFLFFSFFFDLFPLLAIFLLLFLYLIGPTFFFRSWMNLMFGFSYSFRSNIPVDLSSRECLLFFGIPALMYWLGISWQALVI